MLLLVNIVLVYAAKAKSNEMTYIDVYGEKQVSSAVAKNKAQQIQQLPKSEQYFYEKTFVIKGKQHKITMYAGFFADEYPERVTCLKISQDKKVQWYILPGYLLKEELIITDANSDGFPDMAGNLFSHNGSGSVPYNFFMLVYNAEKNNFAVFVKLTYRLEKKASNSFLFDIYTAGRGGAGLPWEQEYFKCFFYQNKFIPVSYYRTYKQEKDLKLMTKKGNKILTKFKNPQASMHYDWVMSDDWLHKLSARMSKFNYLDENMLKVLSKKSLVILAKKFKKNTKWLSKMKQAMQHNIR